MYYQGDIIDNWYINTGSTSLYGKQGNEDNVGFSTQVNPDGYAGWKLTSLSFWCVKGREYKYVIVKRKMDKNTVFSSVANASRTTPDITRMEDGMRELPDNHKHKTKKKN